MRHLFGSCVGLGDKGPRAPWVEKNMDQLGAKKAGKNDLFHVLEFLVPMFLESDFELSCKELAKLSSFSPASLLSPTVVFT